MSSVVLAFFFARFPVVPFCPFSLRVALLKPKNRKKGTLTIKGPLGNLVCMVQRTLWLRPCGLMSYVVFRTDGGPCSKSRLRGSGWLRLAFGLGF